MTATAVDPPLIDSTAFTADEYQAMLNEVRAYLPAFLSASAVEQPDAAGDVRELLALEAQDLERVRAVHACLDERVRAFVEALPQGVRRPVTSTVRPHEVTQAVRGPIDWGATIRTRSLGGHDPSLFVIRPGQRVFDTPENRALAWTLRWLDTAARHGMRSVLGAAEDDDEAVGWLGELRQVRLAVRRALRVEWLREVQPARPTARNRQRLAASRLSFYRHHVGGTVAALMQAQRNDAQSITDALCRRYFRPKEAWRLFEVTVALRIAREFAKPERSDGMRRSRLLAGARGAPAYATYRLHDGDLVHLIYQGWPAQKGPSVRHDTAKRHGFTPVASIPDLFLVRTGRKPDCVILELKATKRPGYLGAGLTQLLGYLAERPDDFGRPPAGWLVAPPSETFRSAEPIPGEALWIVDADAVAAAAADRLAA